MEHVKLNTAGLMVKGPCAENFFDCVWRKPISTLAVPASSLEGLGCLRVIYYSLDIVVKYISVRPYSAKGPIEGNVFNGLQRLRMFRIALHGDA